MVHRLKTPLKKGNIRILHSGDNVFLSGTVYTGRDAFHKYLFGLLKDRRKLPFSLEGAAIYHCGPIVISGNSGWKMIAAGPTTSARMTVYIPELVRRFGIRAFIGKGGLNGGCAKSFMKFGCVYLNAGGGCAQVLAECVKCIKNVYFYDEFGPPEAVWELEVENLPATVTIDAKGNNLHTLIMKKSGLKMSALLKT